MQRGRRWCLGIGLALAVGCGDDEDGQGSSFGAGTAAESVSGADATQGVGDTAPPGGTGGGDDDDDDGDDDDDDDDGAGETAESGGDGDTGVKLDVAPPGDLPEGCTDGAQWIYLLTSEGALLRFYPDDLTFEEVGVIGCAAAGMPYSLAVDRDAVAWALFVDPSGTDAGTALLQVSTDDASCEDSGYAPAGVGPQYFGMGFSSDAPGSSDETLFVSGGRWADGIGHGTTMAILDLDTLSVTPIGMPPGIYAPEMAGTGDAELWGLFVQPDYALAQLDKADASAIESFDISGALGGTSYALAFWGGDFYLFLNAAVWTADPADGSLEQVLEDHGHDIVGAGVSTCAPLVPPG